MRVLITGVFGFVGPYLADHVSAERPDAEIFGLDLEDHESRPLNPQVSVLHGDVTDRISIAKAIEAARPDVVFHLAAASSVADSWLGAAAAFEVNALGAVHLFEAICSAGISPLTVVASSADVYGTSEKVPLTEDLPVEPVSPYGASKAALELVAHQYHLASRVPTIRLRLFNHTGPRQPAKFVASSLARQIAEIETGMRPPRLHVGNLDIRRDFTDVRDVVRAYWLAATEATPGRVYNVCSGTASSIGELVDELSRLAHKTFDVVVDPTLARSADIPVLIGDSTRFAKDTGWTPAIPLRQTLADLLAWWRSELDAQS
jgi:GDP-4-dehydro-6-deoxy-D-mannose reductase